MRKMLKLKLMIGSMELGICCLDDFYLQVVATVFALLIVAHVFIMDLYTKKLFN